MKKITNVLLVVAMAIFILPSISSAQVSTPTAIALQAQIAALLAQIQALQQQLATVQGSGVIWCHTFTTNLGVGSSGSEVSALQQALQKENFEATGSQSGTYDEMTASLVTAFQEKYRSDVLVPSGLQNGTGYVGRATRAKLNALYGCGVAFLPTPAATTAPTAPTTSTTPPALTAQTVTVLSPTSGQT